VSACILAPLAIFLGYFFAENREALVRHIREGEYVVALVVVVVLVLVLVFPRRPKAG
jgi:membrane protein DedA with SNARE-associated domain